MSNFDHRALEGFKSAPQRLVRNLAAAADRYLNDIEDRERRIRALEERLAAAELENAKDFPPVLVIVDHRGYVEVKSPAYVPVHVVELHDCGDPAASEDRARGRTPWRYRGSWDAKTIAAGGPALDKFKLAYLEGERLVYAALNEAAKEGAAPSDSRGETRDAS